jgi:hypothetical protein
MKKNALTDIVQISEIRSKTTRDTFVLSGRDRLGVVTMVVNITPSTIVLYTIVISPTMFLGTRLADISQLWEKYKFTRFDVQYQPSVSSMIGGQMCMYFDPNPDEEVNVADADQALRSAMSREKVVFFTLSKPTRLNMNTKIGLPDYFTEASPTESEKWIAQARFVVLASIPLSSTATSASNQAVGSITADWTVKFTAPQMLSRRQSPELMMWDYWEDFEGFNEYANTYPLSFGKSGAAIPDDVPALRYFKDGGTKIWVDSWVSGNTSDEVALIRNGTVFCALNASPPFNLQNLRTFALKGKANPKLIGRIFAIGVNDVFRIVTADTEINVGAIGVTFTNNGISIGQTQEGSPSGKVYNMTVVSGRVMYDSIMQIYERATIRPTQTSDQVIDQLQQRLTKLEGLLQ